MFGAVPNNTQVPLPVILYHLTVLSVKKDKIGNEEAKVDRK